MKALEWERFFTEQKEVHGKTVFSVAELANAARTSAHAINTELGRLMTRGIVARYAQGRYGPARGVGPGEVVLSIDSGAYITGFYVLFQHSLVTQMPFQITCFTNRRHNRASNRTSPGWTLRFILAPPAIYHKPASGVMAPAEQAFCDFLYLNLRDGTDPRHLVTFRNLQRLKHGQLKKLLAHYPEQVAHAAESIVAARS